MESSPNLFIFSFKSGVWSQGGWTLLGMIVFYAGTMFSGCLGAAGESSIDCIANLDLKYSAAVDESQLF